MQQVKRGMMEEIEKEIRNEEIDEGGEERAPSTNVKMEPVHQNLSLGIQAFLKIQGLRETIKGVVH